MPGNRLSAAGYADQRPIAANDTDAHRADNRRVEVVILSQGRRRTIEGEQLTWQAEVRVQARLDPRRPRPRPGEGPEQPDPRGRAGRRAAVGGYFFSSAARAVGQRRHRNSTAAAATTTTTAPEGEIVKLDAITLNLADNHFLKLGMALQLKKGVKAEAYTTKSAKALDLAISLYGGHTYTELNNPQAREKAKTELAQEVTPPTTAK